MKRERWIDYSRAVACFLVVIGHLFMSFRESGIIENSNGLDFFIETIYHFHVYIFFFCSGFLFQNSFLRCKSKKEFWDKKMKRVIDMLIPYIVFTFITYILKVLVSGDVNSPINDSFIRIMCEKPLNQMWFLYALIFIDLVTPVIINDKMMFGLLTVSFLMKLTVVLLPFRLVAPLAYLCSNEIWFVIGMLWAYKKIEIKHKYVIWGTSVVFFIGAIYRYQLGGNHKLLDAFLTLIGVISVVEIVRFLVCKKGLQTKVLDCLAKYMFQIYLMHTICAACIRVVLNKIGISNFPIQLILGLIFSFVVPIICAVIMNKSIFLNIFIYPTKTVQKIRKKKCIQETQ